MGARGQALFRGPDLFLDAAADPVPYGTSNAQGLSFLDYLRRHEKGGAFIMNNPIPTANPAEFGSYEN